MGERKCETCRWYLSEYIEAYDGESYDARAHWWSRLEHYTTVYGGYTQKQCARYPYWRDTAEYHWCGEWEAR